MRIKFEQSIDDSCIPFAFDLPSERLILVARNKNLSVLASALESCTLLGLDTETRPNFKKRTRSSTSNRTSLIQIASRSVIGLEYVFIVDIFGISSDHDNTQTLDKILVRAFSDVNVVKFGQEIIRDIAELNLSYPMMDSFRFMNSILDTNIFYRYLQPDNIRNVSLKFLVTNYLNFNLIKTQQCSDWEKRPLSDAQIQYAACDALVLLRLYDAMVQECVDLFGADNSREELSTLLTCCYWPDNGKSLVSSPGYGSRCLADPSVVGASSAMLLPTKIVERKHIYYADEESEDCISDIQAESLEVSSFASSVSTASSSLSTPSLRLVRPPALSECITCRKRWRGLHNYRHCHCTALNPVRVLRSHSTTLRGCPSPPS